MSPRMRLTLVICKSSVASEQIHLSVSILAQNEKIMIRIKPPKQHALPGTLWHPLSHAKSICDHANPSVWPAAFLPTGHMPLTISLSPPFITRAQILDEFPLNLASLWLLTQSSSLEETLQVLGGTESLINHRFFSPG